MLLSSAALALAWPTSERILSGGVGVNWILVPLFNAANLYIRECEVEQSDK